MKCILLAALSAVGIVVSMIFLLVQYRLVAPDSRYLPLFCRLDQRSCGRVLSHRDARLFGVPNAVPGLLYYIPVLIVASGIKSVWLTTLVLWLSWVTVALAVFLVYSLYFRVKASCTLCLIAHGVNLLLFIVLTFW